MSDTYIPSGEESAQEQQFLQALAGNIQDPKASPVPKYATQLFANFGGNYLTLVPNATQVPAYPFGYASGMCIAMSLFNSYTSTTEFYQIAGQDASGGAYFGNASWWDDPAVDYYNRATVIKYDLSNQLFNYLSYYRQNWSTYDNAVYVFIPKWMKTLTMGARLYDSTGAMNPVAIASKTNAKWQSATVNSGETSDARLSVGEILTPNQLRADPNYWQIISKTNRTNTSPGQFKLYNESVFVTGLTERQESGQSVVTLELANYYPRIAITPPYRFAVNNWDSTFQSDPQSTNVTWPQGYDFYAYFPTPGPIPDQTNYPQPNCTLEVDPVRRWPIPVSLPYVRYFRLIANNFVGPPSLFNTPWSATYGIYYPANYPAGRPTLLPMGASTDIFKIQPCNYSVVDPPPAGLPTPPIGIPSFAPLTLATMPIIGVDITAPL